MHLRKMRTQDDNRVSNTRKKYSAAEEHPGLTGAAPAEIENWRSEFRRAGVRTPSSTMNSYLARADGALSCTERQVREALQQDRAQVAAVLAAAFQDDPVMTYILPRPDIRVRKLAHVFSLLFDEDLPSGRCLLTANGQASTLWQGPDAPRGLTPARVASGLSWFRALGTACGRGLAYDSASNANRPKQRHWYLHVAGCAPDAQGRGFGSAAIRAGLRAATRENLVAYLETSKEQNVGLYQSLGFRVTHTWQVGGVLNCWSMLRQPG